jgi:hypothetical protein
MNRSFLISIERLKFLVKISVFLSLIKLLNRSEPGPVPAGLAAPAPASGPAQARQNIRRDLLAHR